MTLILPSCACTLRVYLSLRNLMLFFPQDGPCPGEDSELCSGGETCHVAWGWRERRHSWEWGWTETCSWGTRASLNWNKTTPFEHDPHSDESLRLKPGHSFSEYTSLGCKSYGVKTLGFLREKKHFDLRPFWNSQVREIQGSILRAWFQYTSECNNMTPNITHQQKRIDMNIE